MAIGGRRTVTAGELIAHDTVGQTVKAEPGPTKRVALLVIRAWCEDGEESSLRARILEVPDLEAGEERVSMASRREELHALVDRWLDDLREP